MRSLICIGCAIAPSLLGHMLSSIGILSKNVRIFTRRDCTY